MQQSATLNWALGEYVLESVIRAGGRSTVYAARKRGAAELRALKVITIGPHPEARAIADAERRGAELQQEFARHHGLVPWVEEIGETSSCLYVGMEFVPGEDLFDVLTRGPIPMERAREIAIELATFLERTHRFEVPGRAPERIIHADLKPGNIRLRPDGRLCVLDFGIAKAMAERRIETTQKWGTRQYMSPEWLHTGTIDEQVDYWSLGVLLYEMLAGYRPFRRFERHDNELEDAIRRRERPEPLPSRIDIPLQDVIGRLLAPEIRQRFASAAAIRAALEATRNGTWRGLKPVLDVPTLPVTPRRDVATLSVSRREDVRTDAVTPGVDVPTEAVSEPGAGNGASAGPDLPTEAVPRIADTPPTEAVPRVGDVPTEVVPRVADVPTEAVLPPPLPSLALPPLAVPPPLPGAVVADQSAAPVDAPRPAGRVRRHSTLRKVMAAGLWVLFTFILATEGIACIAAERLRSDAAVAEEGDLDATVARRMQLAGWTMFDVAVRSRVDPVLHDRLVSLADIIIADYRQEQPTVGRPEWERARTWLTHAAGISPTDRRVRAMLRYTEGHLQRLVALRRAEGGQAKLARQSYYTAIQKFREAAALDSKWPDPYLGITHVSIYGVGDVDTAVDALNNAEKRGYRLNRRERAQLGDGYRARGERTWRSARGLDDEGQQKDAYERAQKDFKKCVESFTPIVEFANAADQLHRCEARLAEIDERITPWWRRLLGSNPELEITLPETPRSVPPQ